MLFCVKKSKKMSSGEISGFDFVIPWTIWSKQRYGFFPDIFFSRKILIKTFFYFCISFRRLCLSFWNLAVTNPAHFVFLIACLVRHYPKNCQGFKITVAHDCAATLDNFVPHFWRQQCYFYKSSELHPIYLAAWCTTDVKILYRNDQQ